MNKQKLPLFIILLVISLIGCFYEPVPGPEQTQEPTQEPTPEVTQEPTPELTLEPTPEFTQIPEESETGYELVLSIDGEGNVFSGNWNNAYNRIINNLENCILRFDNRIAKPQYIEYSSGMIRFDFQSLDAVHNAHDAYAFISIEPDVKAGLGTSYRVGHDDHVWKQDTSQYADVAWNPFTIHVYCEPNSSHTLAASFNSGGGVVQGSWETMYETIATNGADCKIRFDNRILIPPHIEYGDDWFNFDALGLVAHHNGSDAYAYTHVTLNNRAGIGTSYRRGIASEVYKKDRDQYVEYEWRGMGIDVFCNDKYSEEFIFNSSGNLINNEIKTWDELYQLIVYEARDCKLIYDNRISKPEYIEFSNSSLQFDFTNLHAFHSSSDNYDSFALFYINYNEAASLQACYRRAYAPIVFQQTTSQHTIDFTTDVPVRIRCESGSGYSHELSIDGNGNSMLNTIDEFYELLSSPSYAYNMKLRQDNRITIPATIEYGDTANDPIYFQYHTLAAYHNYWDCFALTYMHKDNPSGLTGSYRRGHADEVWKRTLMQHSIYTPIFQTDVDFFLKKDY